jgi:nucleotide-binding universal stress UspA family protein
MFKHILVATDGSKLSGKAIRTAVKLAESTGAKVTGAYVIAPFVPAAYGEGMMYVPALSPAEYRKLAERAARKALATVEIEARTAKAAYAGAVLTADNPWKGIIRAAKAKKCDLIVMSSHGRRGLTGLLLGSETTKVLTHSRIPVLVCR